MTKKLITLLLALTMVFASAVPVMALSNTSATYQQDKIADAPSVEGQFTVTLSIHGDIVDNDGPIERHDYIVNMGAVNAEDVYFVSDVLEAAETQFSWLSFNYAHHGFDPQPLNYVNAVYDSGVSTIDFAPITDFSYPMTLMNYRNGWMFRVNKQYPILHPDDVPLGWDESVSGKPGASIKQAYIQANDHIDLYFANTYDNPNSTRTVILEEFSRTDDSITIKGWNSRSFYNSNDKWIIYDYSAIPSNSGTFTFKVDGVSVTKSFGIGGKVTFDDLEPGTHTIELMPTYTTYNYTINNVQHTCQFIKFTICKNNISI